VTAYVIMPNHLHVILHLADEGSDLNKIIANGKRFLAYGIINLLREKGKISLLKRLSGNVRFAEQKKGQIHRVFNSSFDAKYLASEKFLYQKLDYIHHNPVMGKWNLAKDFTAYEHSSASYYELGLSKYFKPIHFKEFWDPH
jgi:REP element-mobilizing transposase RayT